MKPSVRAAKILTLEDARAGVLAKTAKAGSRGAASLFPPSAPAAKQAVFGEAITLLEGEQAIFVDRRKAKPRYFAWADRPVLPSVESVAARLEQTARDEFPALATRPRWKIALKSHREEAGLLEPAIAHLLDMGRLIRLLYRKASKAEEVFLPLEMLVAPAPPSRGAFSPGPVREAYRRLAARTGFPAVPIATLQQESAAEIASLQSWLVEEHRAGRAILSRGDWSLADEAKRAAAVEWQGDAYLLVRLL